MTNQAIPPCPVCGVVPRINTVSLGWVHPGCKCITGRNPCEDEHWEHLCGLVMLQALRASGITTIAQLNERLATKPVVIVHGLTEAEVHEAAGLLAKSREMCEQPKLPPDISSGDYFYDVYKCGGKEFLTKIGVLPTYCPSCGRKVKIV